MQRSQRVTLADIAARSGVSTATASMILSERPDVSFSRETILRVREAAEALGYRAIRRHRPSHFMAGKSVAILCPNVVNPYYATLVQSVQDAAARHDYDTMVFPTYRDAAVEARLLRALSAASVGGHRLLRHAAVPGPGRAGQQGDARGGHRGQGRQPQPGYGGAQQP